ncbi:protein tyrosine phosphatase [Thiothrix caldifontis]|uniref:Protein tyrosine phosphatase n=1 Tax=Thiothrix caldifontis TaxID=525918 RepID=A0A1H4GFC7_9GAMM|nr:arsenate reductase ArsC [Thiothrix caldifontis]SEB08323.1 protein tyrosine phosphatase [Thiothrix caldifontis]
MYNVLFLCTGNSARSIMAEVILNRLGIGKFKAYSAGSHPRGEVNPLTTSLLQRLNYETADLRSKDWAEFSTPDAPKLDFVFTVCDKAAAEMCPVWAGQPMTAHWGVPDPAEVSGDDLTRLAAFREAYRQLHNRIDIFVNLPLHALDELTLQQHLHEIGNTTLSAAKEA